MAYTNWHPVFRHFSLVAWLLLALATVILSAFINPHSVAWLVGIHLSTGLFLYVWRIRNQPGTFKPFLVYLAIVNQYFLTIWLLHVWVPGHSPDTVALEIKFWARVFGAGSVLVPVAVYHFAIRLCQLRVRLFYLLEWAGWGLAAYFLYCKAMGTFTTGYFWAGFTWVPKMTGAYNLYMKYVLFFALSAVVIPFVCLFTMKDHRRWLQILYFLIGFGLWVLTCTGHLLISLGVHLYPFGGIAFLIHISLLAYALLHKRVFDTSIIVRTGLVYALVSAVFGILFSGLVFGSAAWLNRLGIAPTALSLLPAVVIAGILFGPILHLVQQIVDRRFRRLLRQRSAILEEHAKQIAYTIDLGIIAKSVCTSLYEGTGSGRAVFLVQDDATHWKALAAHPSKSAEAFYVPSEVTAALSQVIERPLLLPVTPEADAAPKPLALSAGNMHLLVPVRHQDHWVAAVLLDPKVSDEPYTEEDLRFAEGIAAQSAMASANARSYTSIRYLREMTSQTLEGLTAGVLLIDRRQRVVVWNETARRLFQWREASPEFSPTLNDLRGQAPQLAEIVGQAVWDHRSQENVELQIAHPKALTLLLSTRLLAESDSETLMLVLLNDVTEYKEMEKVMRRQEGLARLGQLIATINHEVRNILQPLRNQVEGLRGDVERSEKGRRHLENIQNRLRTLDDMLANLKNLARPLELRPRPFNLKSLLDSVCRDVSGLVPGESVDLQVNIEDGTICHGDGNWLRQVFFNLVRNAMEATDGQPHRQVEVSAAGNGDRVTVTVRDNGWGISEPNRERIFEPFFSTKGTAGTGLGLAITRKVIEAHGGVIGVWSQPGLGSKFTVELPAAAKVLSNDRGDLDAH